VLPTVATDVLSLDQTPPDTEFVSVVVAPIHAISVPDILAGVVFTDIVVKEGVQPLPRS
jgi:hypothetical protein